MEEMIEKQQKYDGEMESLQNRLQEVISKKDIPTPAEDENQLKQHITFQQKQIQSLKVDK